MLEAMEDITRSLMYSTVVSPEKVIVSGPATVVLWNDGTKTVAKAHGGDEFDPRVGLLGCAYRKATRNHARVDAAEPVLLALAHAVDGPGQARDLARALELMADGLEMRLA